jgi:penicillin amidase
VLKSNNYQRDGTITIAINDYPIKINLDENAIADVFTKNKADAIRGQEFVLAQDRIFQIEFYRALIKGEVASIVGNSMLQSDIKMRVLNLVGNAKKKLSISRQTNKRNARLVPPIMIHVQMSTRIIILTTFPHIIDIKESQKYYQKIKN